MALALIALENRDKLEIDKSGNREKYGNTIY